METTTRLHSICCPNLIEQLACSTAACFISCTLGDTENMISTAGQWHTQASTGTHTPTCTDINSCEHMYNPFPNIRIRISSWTRMLHCIYKQIWCKPFPGACCLLVRGRLRCSAVSWCSHFLLIIANHLQSMLLAASQVGGKRSATVRHVTVTRK